MRMVFKSSSLSIILYKNPISINFYDEAIVKPLMNV